MKLCPYCSSQIEDEDAKCRFCGEWVIRRRRRSGPRKKKRGAGRRPLVLLAVILLAAWGGYRLFSSPDTAARVLGRPTLLETVRADLDRLSGLEADYAREHERYTGNTFALGFSASEGVTVSLTATPTGWAATATHRELPSAEGCAVFVGTAKPPTSPVSPEATGEVVCTG